MPAGMILKWIEVPDTLPIESIGAIPADAQAFRQLGDDWLNHGSATVLRVPSVLAPRQWNLLLNPAHSLFPAIKTIQQSPFAFDSRLLSSFPNP
jgi:RES domain-containing protein